MANLGWIQQNPYSHKLNLALGDEPFDDIMAELNYFKQEGGQSIVEVTTVGIVRDVEYLAKAASATGLNIIAGTGYYLDSTLPAEVKSSSVEELSKVNSLFISYMFNRREVLSDLERSPSPFFLSWYLSFQRVISSFCTVNE